MSAKTKLFMGVCALVVSLGLPAMAEVTQSVTQKSSTVNPDGSVSYESHTVTTKDPAVVGTTTVAVVPAGVVPVATFYYYSPVKSRIIAANDLTNDVIDIWDSNNNKVIDNHEFYTNQMVVYEPVEYSKRTYQDIDMDGIPELTKEEYTLRLQQVPTYAKLNKDSKEGLTLYEFTGVGFQDADNDNDNQVSYDELKEAFYHQAGLAPKPEKTNQ
jgi:hypothetical protein